MLWNEIIGVSLCALTFVGLIYALNFMFFKKSND